MMKRKLIFMAALSAMLMLQNITGLAQQYVLNSPDERIRVEVGVSDITSFAVFMDDKAVIAGSPVSLHTEQHGVFGIGARLVETEERTVDQLITPVVKQKSAQVRDHYNELRLIFQGNYSLCFRAFDEGVAYRWESKLKGEMIVVSEEMNLNFTANHMCWFPEEESMFTHQEREYLNIPLKEITPDRFSSVPVMIDMNMGPKLVLTESDLQDYPGFYLMGGTGKYSLKARFPRVVVGEELKNDRDLVPVSRAGYIAKVSGKRSFPWRIIAIAENDEDLITNQMVFLLSEPCKIEDPSWIKPGKVAWDWWNFNNVYKVDFTAGINTATYKHYIDFASNHKIDYIILDEGWYELGDLTKLNPNIDMEALLAYGKKKNVGIILWVVWKTLDDQLEEVMPVFEDWGIAGLKVDFMQRDDQWMVNYYWRIAEEAARRKFLVDFHGSYKPAGLHRTWPNVLTREGVRGMEWSKWSDAASPEGAVTLPFIRMLAGPMDYTPGAMINATKDNFRPVMRKPMSQGTRAHQLAMYVVFESPLQMLADNPTHYTEEPECMQFLSEVPVVWDETVVLDAEVGEYVLIARRNGYQWYIGAMTDWSERDMEISLDFLGERKFEAVIWKDGPNAHRNASDYKKESMIVDKNSMIKIHLAPGGGWAAILRVARL